jgi:hypothetical protein
MPDADFERTFADLAHASLRDRAPVLLDHLVGFQLLDKSDDDSHAVGVWGFKVGNEWMYAPTFFLNGQLKGDELLYIKSQDAFVPLKENWINYLLNRRPHILGEHEPKKPNELGIRQPDFDTIARPPYVGSKYASSGDVKSLVDYLTAHIGPEFQPFLPVAMEHPGAGKRASLTLKWHLPHFIKSAGQSAATTLVSTMRGNQDFADAVLKFYTMDDIIKAAEAAFAMTKEAKDYPVNHPYLGDKVKVVTGKSKGKTGVITTIHKTEMEHKDKESDGTQVEKRRTDYNVVVTLSDDSAFPTTNPSEDLVEYSESASKAVEAADGDKLIKGTAPRVRVMFADRANVLDLDSAMLTEDEQEKLLRDRYVVQDNRGDGETSKVYKTQIPQALNNPAKSGWQRVIMASGAAKSQLVLCQPKGDAGRTDRDKSSSIVVDLDGGNRIRFANEKDIFVTSECPDASEWEEKFNGLSDPSGAKQGDKVIFVNSKCQSTVPLFVRMKITNDEGQTTYYGEFDRFPYAGGDNAIKRVLYPRFRGRRFNESDAGRWHGSIGERKSSRPYNYEICFVITDKDGAKVTQMGDDYFVPNGFKMIKVSKKDIEPWKLRDLKPDKHDKGVPDWQPAENILATAQTVLDTKMNIFKSASARRVQAVSDGIEFWLRVDGRQGKPLSKLAAMEQLVVKHGMREGDALDLLKQANRVGGPTYVLGLPEYLVKQAQGSPHQPAAPALPEPITGVDPTIGVPVQYPQEELINAGPGDYQRPSQMDMDATFYAQQASNQGQKEVMDTAVITGLVKTMDPGEVVDQYLGDLMLGLDRVGRILFMYYWHYDKFKERYGAQDMPELEDNLKNVFDNLGDLALFLKQKTVEPEVSGATAEAELSEVL